MLKTNPNHYNKIVILGHTGFIGRHVCATFYNHAKTNDVIGLSSKDVDLTSHDDTNKLLEYVDNTSVIIMCSCIKRHVEENENAFFSNLAMVNNTLNIALKKKVSRFIFLSSASVYGEHLDYTAITEDTLVGPISYYGIAKYAAERLILKTQIENNWFYPLILRPSIVYGHDDATYDYSPVGFIKSYKNNGCVTLWGDGSELRDFIYVSDVATIIKALTFRNVSGIYNLASGKSSSFKKIIEIIANSTNINIDINIKNRTKPKVNQLFDNTKLLSVVPNYRFLSIKKGVKKIIQTQVPFG